MTLWLNRYKARDTGIFFPSLPWCGKVAAVYTQAINILHPDNLLVSLIKNQTHMTALSILVPSLFECNHASIIKQGHRAVLESSRMILSRVRIDLEESKSWEGCLHLEDVRYFHLWKLPFLREALLQEGKRGGFLALVSPDARGLPLITRCSRALDMIVSGIDFGNNQTSAQTRTRASTRYSNQTGTPFANRSPAQIPTPSSDRSSTQAISGLSQLVGLGIGFTPSGDDFISGVLLGERMARLFMEMPAEVRQEPHLKYLPVNKEEIQAALDKTSLGGKTLLWQALQGQFPCCLLRAARGLSKAKRFEDMLDMVKEAVSHGETSGTDALTGLLWYLEIAGNAEVKS